MVPIAQADAKRQNDDCYDVGQSHTISYGTCLSSLDGNLYQHELLWGFIITRYGVDLFADIKMKGH